MKSLLTNPTDLWLVTRDGFRHSLSMSDDDRRYRHTSAGKPSRVFPFDVLRKLCAKPIQQVPRTGIVKRSAPPVLPKTLYPLDGIRLAYGSTNSICRGADTNLYMTRGSVGWELNPPTCAGLSVNDYLDVAGS